MPPFDSLPRLDLAATPSPLWRHDGLDALVGSPVWVKRDDLTGSADAGNKIRKLEYLLADAQTRGCSAVLTCGGAQSNHARATALCCASLGMRCYLLLRSNDGDKEPFVGNLMLDHLAGASVRWITPDEYTDPAVHLERWAAALRDEGQRPYVIPEGGSNGLGAMGYVRAMHELQRQVNREPERLPQTFDRVVVACGSGGTAAGVALGARRYGVASCVIAVAVCDNRRYFESRLEQIIGEATPMIPDAPCRLVVEDEFIGPGYAVASAAQRACIASVARTTGLVLDPVYSGKAMYALCRLPKAQSTLFIHTGGLPGLLAQATTFDDRPLRNG